MSGRVRLWVFAAGAAVVAALFTMACLALHWTASGVVLGLVSTALAAGCAALAVRRAGPARTGRAWAPVRRLQSGHIGDYVAWTIMGVALLAVLAGPSMLL